jgi:hypothetical protein
MKYKKMLYDDIFLENIMLSHIIISENIMTSQCMWYLVFILKTPHTACVHIIIKFGKHHFVRKIENRRTVCTAQYVPNALPEASSLSSPLAASSLHIFNKNYQIS